MKKRSIINTLLALTFVGFFTSCTPNKNQSSQLGLDTKQAGIINGVDSTAEFQKENGIVGIYLFLQDAQGNQGAAMCTGTLIRPNVVLTAAHCITSSEDMQLTGGLVFFANDMAIIEKDMQTNNHERVRAIAKVAHHELYGSAQSENDSNHDIGLIRLSSDAPADFKVSTILPVELKNSLAAGVSLTLSGFGVNSYVKDPHSGEYVGDGTGVLRQVSNIKVIELGPTGEEIALDQRSGGACHGDSGGPAFLTIPSTETAPEKTYLVGVTSRGQDPCNKDSIYSSAVGYTDWINKNLEKILK